MIDVVTRDQSRSTSVLRVHRSRTLRACDLVVLDGLPVTTVARTPVDLAGILAPHPLRRVVHRAEMLRLLDAAQVAELLARGRPRGARALRLALASLAAADPEVARSELEERFLALVAAAGLPLPGTNVRVHGYEWTSCGRSSAWSSRPTVSPPTSSRAPPSTIGTATSCSRSMGFGVVRFTWRQVVTTPDLVVARLGALLGAPGYPSPASASTA